MYTTSVASVGNVEVHSGRGAIIRLADIAKVTMGAVPQWLLVVDNGRPAVTFDVYQQDMRFVASRGSFGIGSDGYAPYRQGCFGLGV